jgi:hypothetical protein
VGGVSSSEAFSEGFLQEAAGEGRRSSLRPYRDPNVWLGPDGQVLPFEREEEILDFLQTSRVLSQKTVREGVNQILELLVEKEGVEMHAAWRIVDLSRLRMTMADGTVELNFRDCCLFEVAAYRLGRILGLTCIPPVVRRKIKGREGSLQLWIEGATMEKERKKKGLTPPNPVAWFYQRQTMRLFDSLIYNEDRNLGNLLIDSSWKLWLIDHTRAFRLYEKPKNLESVLHCDRELFERLKQLDRGTLDAELKGLLKGSEIKALLSRRDHIVNHFERRIEARGEAEVLF